jgi:biopolymer transport protein ExbB/TolQ
MELSLLEIWETMGFLARAVAISLIVMGLASVFVAIERLMVMSKAMQVSARFATHARPLLEERDISSLHDLTKGKEYANVPLPRLFRYGLETFVNNEDAHSGVGAVEMARRELARKLEMLSAEARRGMGVLASTGSTAPFIGLFGTVIGIITAFQGIAASGGGGIGAVSAGIAEALIVTAVGLFVAISAVLTFNYLTARFEKFDMMMQHAASELVDHLEGVSEDGDGRSA